MQTDSFLVINHTKEYTRVAVIEHGRTQEVHIESAHERTIVGSIFKGRVIRILPGISAAFIDIGLQRTAFLYAQDVIPPKGAEDAEEERELPRLEAEKPDKGIENLLAEGQEIIVQVVKEPFGSKGARVTCNISIPGPTVVLLTSVEMVGVSRRIEDQQERERLRVIGYAVKPKGMGLILRTSAEGAQPEQIEQELKFLLNLWHQIKQGAQSVDPPALLYEDLNLLLRAARDFLNGRYRRIYIDSEDGYRAALNFIRRFSNQLVEQVHLYSDDQPIFESYGVEREIADALKRRVWLKSGGYIVVEHTEALTVIDVNTGKYVGRVSIEETALKTNLEAATEIAHQLRLRNIGGIIVVDFIDMEKKEHRKLLWECLQEEFKKDPARPKAWSMTKLGLMEITRKRIRPSLLRRLTEPCFYCEGKGFLRSSEAICQTTLSSIYQEIRRPSRKAVHVLCNPTIIDTLMQKYRDTLESMEERWDREIVLVPRKDYHFEQIDVFTQG